MDLLNNFNIQNDTGFDLIVIIADLRLVRVLAAFHTECHGGGFLTLIAY